jgi:hypothetical protein
MTNLAHRTIGDYGALGNRELELLRGNECPDCRSKDLAPGPRGNLLLGLRRGVQYRLSTLRDLGSARPRLMLRLIREYGGGVVMAFQDMFCNEMNDNTRTAITTNTSIKYAASPEAKISRSPGVFGRIDTTAPARLIGFVFQREFITALLKLA